MKKCTYCGKEHTDEATACVIDGFPLEQIDEATACVIDELPFEQIGRPAGPPKSPQITHSPAPSQPVSQPAAQRPAANHQYQYAPAASATDSAPDFRAFLDLATPELYERNAFRLLEVHVEATERDLAKRKQVMEVASRNKLPVPSGPCRILPRTPAPDDHEIRECSHAIQDAERRLAQEFFWFWPLTVGQAGNDTGLRQLHQGDSDSAANTWRGRERSPEEGPASKHNLAILHHFAALEIEKEFLNGKSPPPLPDGANTAKGNEEMAKTADAERYWAEANKYWKVVAVEQSCWSRVVARIRAMDDKSLTTGAARRMERRLPVALTLINARLAIRAHQNGKTHHCQRHVARIRGSGFGAEAVDEALRIAVEPTRSAIKTICDLAKKDTDADPAKADAVIERLLEQTSGPLALFDLLLPENNPARIAEHDQVALAALSCQIAFGNKTDNWKRSLELLNRLTPLAASTAAKERIAHNQKIVQNNFEDALCWFCGQNPGDDKFVHEVGMHGEIQHIPIPGGTRTTWRHMKVKVPRCQACRSEASKQENIGTAVWVGFLPGCGVWVAMSAHDLVVPGFFVGMSIPVILGIITNRHAKKHSRPGLKKRAATDYSVIKKLQSEGWTFGEKPEGVQ